MMAKEKEAAKEKEISELSPYWKSQNASRAAQNALAGRMRPVGRVFETSGINHHKNFTKNDSINGIFFNKI